MTQVVTPTLLLWNLSIKLPHPPRYHVLSEYSFNYLPCYPSYLLFEQKKTMITRIQLHIRQQ
jgi:hypothetical protein